MCLVGLSQNGHCLRIWGSKIVIQNREIVIFSSRTENKIGELRKLESFESLRLGSLLIFQNLKVTDSLK